MSKYENYDYRLGQPVKVWAKLVRIVADEHRGGGWWPKIWAAREFNRWQDGIVIGKRTLYDGEVNYTFDAGVIFRPKSHFTAWLVVTDMHRKPILVWPKDIQPCPAFSTSTS